MIFTINSVSRLPKCLKAVTCQRIDHRIINIQLIKFRDCAIIIWRGGVGKWAKYGSKLSRTPPLTRQKLTLVPPSPTDNLKVTLPSPASSTIGSLIPSLRVGCLPQAQKVLQTTIQRTSSLHRNHLTLWMCRPRSSYLELLHLLEHLWQHFFVHGSELI